MGVFLKGNKLGCGKKGRSGRKSATVEKERLDALVRAWFDEGVDVDFADDLYWRLKKRKGNIKLFELYLVKGLFSEKVLIDQAKKIIPDKQQISGDPERPLFPPVQIVLPSKNDKF